MRGVSLGERGLQPGPSSVSSDRLLLQRILAHEESKVRGVSLGERGLQLGLCRSCSANVVPPLVASLFN